MITYSDILQKMDSGHLPMWRWVNQLINTKKESYTDADIDIVKDIDIGIYIDRLLNLFELQRTHW